MSVANDRDILDEIDDVITWHGRSADAMVWTAEPLKPLNLPVPVADPEAARRIVVRLGADILAFTEAMRPAVEQMMRNFGAIVQAFNGIINTPPMQELVREQRRARSAMKNEYGRRRRARGRRR